MFFHNAIEIDWKEKNEQKHKKLALNSIVKKLFKYSSKLYISFDDVNEGLNKRICSFSRN